MAKIAVRVGKTKKFVEALVDKHQILTTGVLLPDF
jgi:hypothetical protein